MTNKRGFLKLASALVGGLMVTKLSAAPIIDFTKKVSHDWVEDRGDFYIVRVPDYKTFSNEVLDKPTVFLLGDQTTVRGVSIDGYANVYSKNGYIRIVESRFDCSLHTFDTNRNIIEASGYKQLDIFGCQFYNSPMSANVAMFDHTRLDTK